MSRKKHHKNILMRTIATLGVTFPGVLDVQIRQFRQLAKKKKKKKKERKRCSLGEVKVCKE